MRTGCPGFCFTACLVFVLSCLALSWLGLGLSASGDAVPYGKYRWRQICCKNTSSFYSLCARANKVQKLKYAQRAGSAVVGPIDKSRIDVETLETLETLEGREAFRFVGLYVI